MKEARFVLVSSVSGDAESVYEEILVPYEDDDASANEAALRAASWLRTLAESLEKAARS